MRSTKTNTKTSLVRFADTAQLHTFSRKEHKNIDHHELWYTAAEIHSMRRTFAQDVRHVRAQALAEVPFNSAGGDDDTSASADESSVCYVGMENFLTADLMLEMTASRERCIYAVLVEQARHDLSTSTRFRCEAIALASFAQTRKVVRRARMLGSFHQDSI